ncbi:MAG: peptidoglycan-binding protein [Microcoleus sp. PH2017_17_BER_D_A]|nr:peptidoglycan-binding protein [Microcoleus sp. PH2017_17_BER_D_A]
MQTLKLGASGSDVVKLQKRLLELGLNPGPADGKFGPKTEASLKQFQTNQKFLANASCFVPWGTFGIVTFIIQGDRANLRIRGRRRAAILRKAVAASNLAGRSIGNYDRHRLRSRLQHSRSFQPRLAEIRGC